MSFIETELIHIFFTTIKSALKILDYSITVKVKIQLYLILGSIIKLHLKSHAS